MANTKLGNTIAKLRHHAKEKLDTEPRIMLNGMQYMELYADNSVPSHQAKKLV